MIFLSLVYIAPEDRLLPCMTRKNVSCAYFNGELWNELLEKNLTNTFKISNMSTRESVMRKLDSMRKQELYPHPDCTDKCKKQGTYILQCIFIHIKTHWKGLLQYISPIWPSEKLHVNVIFFFSVSLVN